jgi:YidC/Oxa1 family membrane protein insertase
LILGPALACSYLIAWELFSVDKRFFAWMLLTMSLFLLWTSMNQRAEQQKVLEARQAAQLEAKRMEDARNARANAAKLLGDVKVDPYQEPPTELFTLGTMKPEDKYQLLVTLTNKGAGLQRVELVERRENGRLRYRSLAHQGGYLGYLGLDERLEETAASGVLNLEATSGDASATATNADAPESKANASTPNRSTLSTPKAGKRIRVVPVGSPAEAATCKDSSVKGGLAVGDILLKVDGLAIEIPFDVERALGNRRPGTTVDVEVIRGDADSKPLVFSVVLDEQPLDVVRYEDDYPSEGVKGNDLRESLLTTLAKVDNLEITPGFRSMPGLEQTLDGNWQSKVIEVENGSGIEFTLPLQSMLVQAGSKANLELVKRYKLLKTNSVEKFQYHIDVETLVRNLDDSEHTVALRQEGTNGLSLEAWWYAIKLSPDFFNPAGARDVILAGQEGGHQLISRRDIQTNALSSQAQPDRLLFGLDAPIEQRSLKYIGVDQQYFTSAFLPHAESPDSLNNVSQAYAMAVADPRIIKPYKDIAMNTGFWFDTKNLALPAKGEVSQRYRLFAGPKDIDTLEHYGLSDALYFGWKIFEFVARRLSGILHTFYWLVQNYGIAIMMLTVLVRSCMFPLSRRAAMMGHRMQEMQPELKRINELYKDDMQKRGVEMQALYKKYKINPMASCLPLFIQLPIFIGLYRCVSVDIELRQQPLIPGIQWCSNLAGPDMLALWPTWMPDFIAGRGTGWFGPFMNVLPIVTIILFIVQQKVLMPKATDEQTRLTQQMMMFMTVFMGVLFFKVPAGLCIYFITSSIWSLVERQLVKRYMPAPLMTTTTTASGATAVVAPYVEKQQRPNTSTKSPETLTELWDSIRSAWTKKTASNGFAGSSDSAKNAQANSGNTNPNRNKKRKKK